MHSLCRSRTVHRMIHIFGLTVDKLWRTLSNFPD